MQVAEEIAKVLIGPGWPRLPVEAWLGMVAVPSQTEAIAIRSAGCFQRPQALRYQRVFGLGDVVFEGSGFAAIGNPSAHALFLWPERQLTGSPFDNMQLQYRPPCSRMLS